MARKKSDDTSQDENDPGQLDETTQDNPAPEPLSPTKLKAEETKDAAGQPEGPEDENNRQETRKAPPKVEPARQAASPLPEEPPKPEDGGVSEDTSRNADTQDLDPGQLGQLENKERDDQPKYPEPVSTRGDASPSIDPLWTPPVAAPTVSGA